MVVSASKNIPEAYHEFILSHPCYEFWGRIEEVAEIETSEEKKVHRLEETNSSNVMRLVFR